MMQIEENGHQMGFSRKFMMENAGAAATKRIKEKYPMLAQECSWNWSLLEKMKSVKLLTGGNLEELNNLKFNIIIDGILGTGIAGEIREPHASTIEFINGKVWTGVVAVDVPSGLNPDTGEANKRCVNANMTVTFHRMKVGMPKAKDYVCGEIFVEKIGIPPEAEIGVL